MSRSWWFPALLVALLGLGACTNAGAAPDPTLSTPTSSQPAPSRATSGPGPTAPSATRIPTSATRRPAGVTTAPEPSTTNTLPPPPPPTRPAPTRAGSLTALSLPIPAGWRPVAKAGGSEEGYEGNGTWVHARDPRYAALAVVSVGCAPVTRDDYPDPISALEGNYEGHRRDPGVGLVLQFRTRADAAVYYHVYLSQLAACRGPHGPAVVKVVRSPLGFVDQRSATDADWTEVGRLVGSRLTLVILFDPHHRRTLAQSEKLLRQISS